MSDKNYYKPLPDSLTIKDSKIHGLGLFAVDFIPANTDLGITHIKNDKFVNGYSRTPLGGFFNHDSKNPNCKVLYVDEYINLLTLKDIQPGEELMAEYTFYNPEV